MGKNCVALLVVPLVAALVAGAEAQETSPEKKVVCYYTNWSYKRAGEYSFTPDKVNPFVCTHIIYAFADIGSRNNLIAADPEFDFNRRAYANITGLKKINKKLKVMIGIGGWVKGTIGFGVITANETNRKEFAKNAVRFIRGYMFDGLDLNWQHPTFREGGTPEDKENYVLLAQTLREEFEKEAELKNKPRLLLSIAIAHHQKFLPAYDIANFNNYMDFISVICYDYHFSYEAAVNHHSPLYSLEEDNDYSYDSKININYTIQYFMELASPEKLVMGIPTYGRTYKLEDPADTALGSHADGPGEGGPVTGEKGWFAYFEICNFVNNENWTVVQTKPGSAGPYAYKGDQWVCYDDLAMIRHKAAYANDKGLGGVMFWTIDYDDFLGKCQKSKFPLIRAARDALTPLDSMTFPVEPEEENEASPQSAKTGDVTETQPLPAPVVRQPPPPRRTTVQAKKGCNLPKMKPSSPVQSVPLSTDDRASDASSADDDSDVSVPQSNIVGELIRLIERAGGMKSLCKILRQDTSPQMRLLNPRRRDNENSILLETANTPPILLLLSNSSITIKEVNVFHRP